MTNYFQQGFEKVGRSTKEVWHFAIGNLLKLAKATINEAQWCITINLNYFDEINFYFAGWLSGANPEVLQLTDVGNAINKSMAKSSQSQSRLKQTNGSSLPRFGIQTVHYTAMVTGCTKMVSPVYMITCIQRNLRRLFPMIKENFYLNSYNEFISTKATQEHRWDKLGEHILFYSSKQYFFAAGEGLSNAVTSTVLSEQVTYLGQTSTLCKLLTSKKSSALSNILRQGAVKSSVNTMTQQSSNQKPNQKHHNTQEHSSLEQKKTLQKD
jgi:hypothetical protein